MKAQDVYDQILEDSHFNESWKPSSRFVEGVILPAMEAYHQQSVSPTLTGEVDDILEYIFDTFSFDEMQQIHNRIYDRCLAGEETHETHAESKYMDDLHERNPIYDK